MGQVVLDAGPSRGDIRLYAHCLRSRSGGVAIAAVNLSRTEKGRLGLSVGAVQYELTSNSLEGTSVMLNGANLALTGNDELPHIAGKVVSSGVVELSPASVSFVEIAGAGNAACR
jgi:hypothetical protein